MSSLVELICITYAQDKSYVIFAQLAEGGISVLQQGETVLADVNLEKELCCRQEMSLWSFIS